MDNSKSKQTPNNEAEKKLEAIDKAIELQPEDTRHWGVKATILRDLGRYDEALESINKAIELEPKIAGHWGLKAIILEDLKRYDEALEPIDKAIELEPKIAGHWWLKAIILEDLKRYDEALEPIDKAIELEPKIARHWWLKANILRYSKRYDEALQAIDKAIELEPDNAHNWWFKAVILEDLKRYDEAIDKAIELEPENADLYNMKGIIMMEGSRYDDALGCFDSALRRQINHLYLFNRGTALVRLKRIDEAEDAITRARDLVKVSKDKADQEARKHYDDVLKKLRVASKPISWWDWWFTQANKPRRGLGVFLILVVVTCLFAPFVREGKLGWFNCGKDWGTYLVPAVISTLLLILPVITKFGTQGIEVSPMLRRPEIDISEQVKTIKPRLQ